MPAQLGAVRLELGIANTSCPVCIYSVLTGRDPVEFTRQPTFQYPHPPSPVSLSLSLSPSLSLSLSSSSFPLLHLYFSLSLSHQFLIFPFFCLGLAFLFVRDSPSAGLGYPDWPRLPPPSIPYSASLSPAHTSSSFNSTATISRQFNRFHDPFPS